jgi:hypothetical protein
MSDALIALPENLWAKPSAITWAVSSSELARSSRSMLPAISTHASEQEQAIGAQDAAPPPTQPARINGANLINLRYVFM